MSTNVHLTPALEQFARDVVAEGRYNNVSEVVRSGLRMLQDAEARRQTFTAMLHEVEAEVDRDGSVSAEEVFAGIDQIIDEAERGKRTRT